MNAMHDEPILDRPAEMPAVVQQPAAAAGLDAPAVGSDDVAATAGDWHAEAGRKGALRIHQLIEEGRLYEREHGLTEGRQRLRQLIEQGKRYEEEHGLRPARRVPRRARQSTDQLLRTLLQTVLRLSRSGARKRVAHLIEALDQPAAGPDQPEAQRLQR